MGRSKHTAQTRLASYGSLAPGQSNHAQLDGLAGRWFKGRIRGRLMRFNCGPDAGYRGLILDPNGEAIELMIFESPDLPGHWDRLDTFEGENYRRQTCIIDSDEGPIAVMLYTVED